MIRTARLSILLLCDDDQHHANATLDHIDALKSYSNHHVRTFNPRGLTRRYLDFNEFDVVVIHYSLLSSSDLYLHKTFREALASYPGLKVQFIQDEYRWIDEITRAVHEIGVHVLFTCLPDSEAEKVYRPRLPDVVLVPTLAGYVPEELLRVHVPPTAGRPVEIGYRARPVPFWLGNLGHEKVLIAEGILQRAERYHLRCDISWKEEDRIYGRRWIEFLMSCRATLGTGSGASIADYDGGVQRRVDQYLAMNPGARFEEVHKALLQPYEGNLTLDVISPRIFEGIALRTALVLFPGPYSGVIRPDEHYIPLEKDFSNLDEVVEKVRDDKFVTDMTDRAYRDVVVSGKYSYRQLAREFDAALDTRAEHRRRIPVSYAAASVDGTVRRVRTRARLRSRLRLG